MAEYLDNAVGVYMYNIFYHGQYNDFIQRQYYWRLCQLDDIIFIV